MVIGVIYLRADLLAYFPDIVGFQFVMVLFKTDLWADRKLLNLKTLQITLKEIWKYLLHILFILLHPVKSEVINIFLNNYQGVLFPEILWIHGTVWWVCNNWCHIQHYFMVIFLFQFSVHLTWWSIQIKWLVAERLR